MNIGYKLTTFIYVLIYVFDEFFSFFIGNNIAGIIILMSIVFYNFIYKKNKIQLKNIQFSLLILITILGFLASISPYGCNLTQKGLLSYILLISIIFFWNDIELAYIYKNKKIIHLITITIIFLLILDKLGFGIEKSILIGNRNSGPYFERSHLAIYILPVIAIGISLYGFGVSYGLLFISLLLAPSTTLFIGIVFLIPIFLSRLNFSSLKKYLLFVLILFVVLTGFYFFDISSFEERIKGVIYGVYSGGDIDDSYNLSSLVWLNGWSQAWNTLIQTKGLGLGFNQMGCNNFEEIGAYSILIQNITQGIVLNSQDGSTLAAKIISEYGVFGIILIAILTFKSMKVISMLFKSSKRSNIDYINLIGSISILTILFIRGPGGYFQIPVLLAMAMLIYKDRHEFNSNK